MNRHERKKKKTSWKGFLLFLILIVGLYFLWTGVYDNFKEKPLTETDTTIKIEKWETYYSLSDKFNIDSNLFKLYLKLNPIESWWLQAWSYNIKANTTINTLFEQLKNPINEKDIRITILEGWNIYDIDDCLSNPVATGCLSKLENWEKVTLIEPIAEKLNFIEAVRSYDKTKYSFLSEAITLEGFLYPDTYNINPNSFSSEKFITKMLDNFENRVVNKILKDKEPKEILEIVNLASIVEKEEKNSAEKSTVAWILKKRLNNGWMIGADITVCYPHELTADECKMIISKYITEKSEYNTRTMLWLPKTPISNPSFETVDATLNSKDSEFWFYLHDIKTWKIYYASTNAEHEQNKRAYIY